MDNLSSIGKGVGAIFALVVGLAIIAVLVSKNAQTANVLSAGGGAFAGLINAAVAPVTGGGGIGSNAGGINLGSLGFGNQGSTNWGGLLNTGAGLFNSASSGSSGDTYTTGAGVGWGDIGNYG